MTCVEDRDARRGGPKKVSKRRCSSERKPKKKKKCEIQSCPTGTWVDNGWQPVRPSRVRLWLILCNAVRGVCSVRSLAARGNSGRVSFANRR